MRYLYRQQYFEELVRDLVGHYGFPDTDDTKEAVATIILHAPPDMGQFDINYVGDRVAKMMANKVAYDYIQELKHKKQQAETQQKGVSDGPIQGPKV